MAKPRVFVSSSYYDLKHFRSSLDIFIEGLGFEGILSEKGNIAYNPDQPLKESCYREAQTADILVLLIGGRYGSAAGGEERKPTHKFFERYDSITKKEYESAIQRDIPTYILVETNVYAEYQTFLKNKEREDVSYAHVDSANIFRPIEEVLAKPRNNPTPYLRAVSKARQLRRTWKKHVQWGISNVLKVSLQTTIYSLADAGWSLPQFRNGPRNARSLICSRPTCS